jgi:BirA family transcriptional regulator, biotin operon repressor / biotin---[acetyl-CoA-carboxylase] ligase
LTGLGLAIGVALVEVISDLLPDLADKLQLKWSNDLILMGSKVGGILCEAKTEAQIAKVVIGIGLNLDPVKLALPNSTSLSQWTNYPIPNDEQLLELIRNSLLQLQPLANILIQFRRRDFLLGKQISLALGKVNISGKAIGISDRGELRLILANGEIKQLSSGHILEIN